MNDSLSKFLDGAQLHAMLGFLSSLARVLLSPPSERSNITVLKKLSIIVGSVAMAVTAAYTAEQVPSLKAWSNLCALAVGLLAQDILMRITRRADDILDRAENALDQKTKLNRRPKHPRHDDDYYS